jgi:hypothetical protein
MNTPSTIANTQNQKGRADQQQGRAGHHQAHQRDGYGAFSANPVVDPGERQRPQSGGDIHPDAEREDFRRVHAEGSPGIHPAEDEDGGQPLDVEQPSDQEADDVPITAQGAERVAKLAKGVARGAAERLAAARRIRASATKAAG